MQFSSSAWRSFCRSWRFWPRSQAEGLEHLGVDVPMFESGCLFPQLLLGGGLCQASSILRAHLRLSRRCAGAYVTLRDQETSFIDIRDGTTTSIMVSELNARNAANPTSSPTFREFQNAHQASTSTRFSSTRGRLSSAGNIPAAFLPRQPVRSTPSARASFQSLDEQVRQCISWPERKWTEKGRRLDVDLDSRRLHGL